MKRFTFGFAILLGLCGGQAKAGTITYTFAGTGSGTLNGTGFTNQNFSIVMTGDTVNVNPTFSGPSAPGIDGLTATFSVTGVNSGTLTGSYYIFNNQSAHLIGFGSSGDLLAASTNPSPSLATYGLATPIGPAPITLGTSFPIPTSRGPLVLTSASSFTFQAAVPTGTAVPEPGSMTLLGLGALGMLGYRFKRRKTVAEPVAAA